MEFSTLGVNGLAAHTSHTCNSRELLGGQFQAVSLGSAPGIGFPRSDPLVSCPPADPSASVEELRHAIITNLEQSQDAWPPACPPLEPAR